MTAPNIMICFTGGLLAAVGHRVILMARPAVVPDIQTYGLTPQVTPD